MIFYFSGVGNSAWVARQLAHTLQDEVVSIAEESRTDREYVLSPNERVGFVFPVYGWEPPKIVLDFVRRMKMSHVPEYLYFVCTCGDDTGKTAQIFVSALKEKGWKCHAGFSVTMPDTYVCLPGFDVDDDETMQRKIAAARGRVADIAEKLLDRMAVVDCFEGAFPRVKTYVLGGLFRTFLMSPKPFKATDRCTACGLCEKKCPVHNVKVTDRPEWGADCTMCLACYHACPQHAIEYGSQTKRKGQYKIKHLG